MNGWTSGWMDERMDEWIDQRLSEWMDEWIEVLYKITKLQTVKIISIVVSEFKTIAFHSPVAGSGSEETFQWLW